MIISRVLTSFLLFISTSALASDAAPASVLGIEARVGETLRERFPGAKIELLGKIAFPAGVQIPDGTPIGVSEIPGRGEARVYVTDTFTGAQIEGHVRFAAWMKTSVASRRVLPNERLKPENFTTQDVNVAHGLAYELKGLILPKGTDLATLEARQTILEGTFPTTSGVHRIHDAKRGDSIQIKMRSGTISLSTSGTVMEPAYFNERVRVMTGKSKREFAGFLREGGVVEVNL